jgi:hypothetical protein
MVGNSCQLLEAKLLTDLYASQLGAASVASGFLNATTATTTLNSATTPNLDPSLESLVDALAAAKADAVLRSALLQVSGSSPPNNSSSSGLEALFQNTVRRPEALAANPYGSILDNIEIARALALVPPNRVPVANLSLLQAFARESSRS